jgi:hypothetical protein
VSVLSLTVWANRALVMYVVYFLLILVDVTEGLETVCLDLGKPLRRTRV